MKKKYFMHRGEPNCDQNVWSKEFVCQSINKCLMFTHWSVNPRWLLLAIFLF